MPGSSFSNAVRASAFEKRMGARWRRDAMRCTNGTAYDHAALWVATAQVETLRMGRPAQHAESENPSPRRDDVLPRPRQLLAVRALLGAARELRDRAHAAREELRADPRAQPVRVAGAPPASVGAGIARRVTSLSLGFEFALPRFLFVYETYAVAVASNKSEK